MFKIRKSFKITNSHIVRNCYSERCKYSLHTHTAIVECFWEAKALDRAGMVADFGLLSRHIKPIMKMFDEAVFIWRFDNREYRNFIKSTTDKWIEVPFTPSAEVLASMFSYVLNNMTSKMIAKGFFQNGEDTSIRYDKTIYHETRSGYAEADPGDAMWLLEHYYFIFEPNLWVYGPHEDFYEDNGVKKISKYLNLEAFPVQKPALQVNYDPKTIAKIIDFETTPDYGKIFKERKMKGK